MKGLYRIMLLIIVCVTAIVCYHIGFATSSYIIVALGVLLELGFWLRVFRYKKSSNALSVYSK